MKSQSLSFLPLWTGGTIEYFYASHTTDFGVCERQITHLFRLQVFKRTYSSSVLSIPGALPRICIFTGLGLETRSSTSSQSSNEMRLRGFEHNNRHIYTWEGCKWWWSKDEQWWAACPPNAVTPIISPILPRSSYNVTDTLQPPRIGVDILSPWIFYCGLSEAVSFTEWIVEGQYNAHPAPGNPHKLPP